MTESALILRHLCFTGPTKPAALIEFGPGLNVLYGSSDTGKSFVLESIDFMLGGRGPLRDIPERIGYNRIFLGFQTAADKTFTLIRGISGGQFQMLEGLHRSLPNDLEPRTLGAKHSADNLDNLSNFLLHTIGLDNKRIRTNIKGETRSLSFRNLCHLCLVTEEEILKQGSPIESGQSVERTAEYATFKLLLTGVDDSSFIAAEQARNIEQAGAAQIDIIRELLAGLYRRLQGEDDGPESIPDQLDKLEATIATERRTLLESDGRVLALTKERGMTRDSLNLARERRREIDGLIVRFRLLMAHYESDLTRLDGIREAGSLVAALSPQTCPLCGASTEEQHRNTDCDANIEAVIVAADAERLKINLLRSELEDTIRQLAREAEDFDRLIRMKRDELQSLEEEISTVTPRLSGQRADYTELLEKRAILRENLSIWDQIIILQNRSNGLERSVSASTIPPADLDDLSSASLDAFSQRVRQLLASWDFPGAERIHFDESTRDLVIDGKRRGSRGKGMRAITHAAFTIGLMVYCLEQKRPHPGFVVLDSPLLAYREPEGEEDDLSGTDVQERFYSYLSELSDRQVIILENLDPPHLVRNLPTATFFTKNPNAGRYGLFRVATDGIGNGLK